MIFLVFYFPEPSFMTKLFWMVKTIFCYLVPNLSYKGGVTVSTQSGPTIQRIFQWEGL